MGIMDKAKQAAAKAKDAADAAREKAKEQAERKQMERAGRGVIFEGISHDEGRNAQVSLYRDRVERIQARSRLSMSSAKQDMEITPIKSVSSVQAKKDGLWTKVRVFASGNTIEFRFSHVEAQQFRDAIMELILAKDAPTPASPVEAGNQSDVYDQLKKLGELRDAGVLTREEFDAQKIKLIEQL